MTNARTFAASLLFAGLATACQHFGGAVPPADIATLKSSEHGVYRAAVRSAVEPIPVRQLHGWTLHLETAAGIALDSAIVGIDGGMPQHGHGLPTRPRVVRALGHGDYLIEGMKFSMGGWWRMQFVVRASAGVDTVVFNLSL